MSYRKAEQVLPPELIELIQEHVDGKSIYIPRKPKNRREWGQKTNTRADLDNRNKQIYFDYHRGYNVEKLAKKYFLSKKSIQRIIYEIKKII